jgi:hypothetical protein
LDLSPCVRRSFSGFPHCCNGCDLAALLLFSFGHEDWEVEICVVLFDFSAACPLFVLTLIPPSDSLSFGWESSLFVLVMWSWGKCFLGEWVSEGIHSS